MSLQRTHRKCRTFTIKKLGCGATNKLKSFKILKIIILKALSSAQVTLRKKSYKRITTLDRLSALDRTTKRNPALNRLHCNAKELQNNDWKLSQKLKRILQTNACWRRWHMVWKFVALSNNWKENLVRLKRHVTKATRSNTQTGSLVPRTERNLG